MTLRHLFLRETTPSGSRELLEAFERLGMYPIGVGFDHRKKRVRFDFREAVLKCLCCGRPTLTSKPYCIRCNPPRVACRSLSGKWRTGHGKFDRLTLNGTEAEVL